MILRDCLFHCVGVWTNGTKAVVGKMTGGLAGIRVLQIVLVVIVFSSLPIFLKKSVLFLSVFDETVKVNNFIKSQCLNMYHTSF